MRMSKLLAAVLTAGLVATVSARVADAQDDKEKAVPIEIAEAKLGRPVDFQRDVYPILESNCIACHNLAIDEGNLNLEEVELILQGGNRGPAVVAKDPAGSFLLQFASHAAKPYMPPLENEVDARTLTPQELGILKQWIVEGATSGMGGSAREVNWQPLPSHMNSIYAVALSPWARFAAAGRANQVVVYDLGTGREAARLTDPNLASAQFNGQPMYPNGAAHRDFVHSLAFSPDGKMLASGGFRIVKLWQRPENVQRAKVDGLGNVTALAVSPDGMQIAFATADNAIKLAGPDGKVMKTLTGHGAAVHGLAFAPDGQTLYSGSQDKTVRGWNLADGKETLKLDMPSEVGALLVDKDGKQLVTGHADKVIRVWSATPPAPPAEGAQPEPLKPVREMPGHGAAVNSLAWILPNATQFVSGSEDGTARIWELGNGRQVRSIGHGGPVTDVAASADGKVLATAGANNIAKLWDMNGRQLAEMQGEVGSVHAVAQANEDKTVADQLFKLAETEVQNAEKNLKDRQDAVTKAQEDLKKADEALKDPQKKSDDANKALEAAKAELAKKPDDAGLQKKVADAQKAADTQKAELKKATDAKEAAARSLELSQKAVKTAEEKQTTAKAELEAAKKHQEAMTAAQQAAQKADGETKKPLRAVAFSRDGKTLATAGDDNLVHLWSATDGRPLETLRGHGAAVTELAFGEDDVLIAAGQEAAAVLWDTTPDWQLVATLGAAADNPLDVSASPFAGRVLSLDFSRDGKLLAAGSGEPSRSGDIVIWDVAQKTVARKIEDAHSDTVLGLEFSRSGDRIASGAADKFVKVFTVADGKPVRSYEGHTHHVLDVSWRADETRLASAGADNVIKVWNTDTGEQVTTVTGHGKQVTSVQFIGTGDNIITGGGDQSVRLYTASNRRQVRTFGGATDYVYSVAASRDEKVVIAGGADGVLRVWNGANGQSLFTFAPPEPPPGDTQAQADAAK